MFKYPQLTLIVDIYSSFLVHSPANQSIFRANMALITCPECCSKVSSNALSCPSCGSPLSSYSGTTEARDRMLDRPVKKRGFFFYAGWTVLSLVGLFFGSAFVAAVVQSPPGVGAGPSDAELKTAAKRIFATCDMQVLGHVQVEGERLTDAQSTAIVKCVDVMSGAYIEGVKAGRN